jgi:hypothetical protein
LRAVAIIIMTMMTNIMSGVTKLSDDEIEEEAAVVLVLGTGSTGLVEMEVGPGFDVCPLAVRLFHVTLYPLK